MKIYRTRIYRKYNGDGEILWSERLCISRRQYAALKQDMGYYGIIRMELDVAEIPDEAWQSDQVIAKVEKA